MSLAQITKEIRLSSKIIGALFALGIIVFLFFQGGAFIQRVFFPEPPPPPEKKFGDLPDIEFPQSSTPVPEYRINTISGRLPTFSDRINVYEVLQKEASITALKTARDNAFSAGFSENQKSINPSVYSWTMPETGSVLELNIISNNFSISSNFISNPIFESGQLVNPENAIATAIKLIETLGENTNDIDMQKTKTQNYAISNGNLLPSDPFSFSQLTKVTFFQNPINKIPIYYSSYNESNLFLLITFLLGKTKVVEASYMHKEPNLNSYSTYPLKSADQAFEELKNGKGYIINPTADEIVDITEVSLGYYIDDSADQKYIQPIIVFKGKNNFEAFVQAVP